MRYQLRYVRIEHVAPGRSASDSVVRETTLADIQRRLQTTLQEPLASASRARWTLAIRSRSWRCSASESDRIDAGGS